MKHQKIVDALVVLKNTGLVDFHIGNGMRDRESDSENDVIVSGCDRSRIDFRIRMTDNANTLADKILIAEGLLDDAREISEHRKNSPDLMECLKYNLLNK